AATFNGASRSSPLWTLVPSFVLTPLVTRRAPHCLIPFRRLFGWQTRAACWREGGPMKKVEVSKGATKKKVAVITHVIEPNAAGIDVDSTEMFVAVPYLRRSRAPYSSFLKR